MLLIRVNIITFFLKRAAFLEKSIGYLHCKYTHEYLACLQLCSERYDTAQVQRAEHICQITNDNQMHRKVVGFSD